VSDEKRKYRNGVKFVCDAIWACGRNAVDLSSAATNALSAGNHALALSIAVLALEELGKATMIDGLLFAKAGDHKTKVFEDGHRRHPKKLERVPALHMCSALRTDSSHWVNGSNVAFTSRWTVAGLPSFPPKRYPVSLPIRSCCWLNVWRGQPISFFEKTTSSIDRW
jgi:hypothetical protein